MGEGPEPQVGPGLAESVISEMFKIGKSSRPTLAEWTHRDELQQEIDLSHSPAFDSRTRIPRGRWLEPDAFVKGRVKSTPGGDVEWELEMVSKSGESIGKVKGRAHGRDFFDADKGIARRLTWMLWHWWHRQRRHHRSKHPVKVPHLPRPPQVPQIKNRLVS